MNPWLALYQLAFPAVGVAVAGKMLLGGRGRTLREGLCDLRQRLGAVAPDDAARAGASPLWLHAASVGEIAGAAALLRALGPDKKALITTSTVAGRNGARGISGAAASVLAPMDLLPAVHRFLDGFNPRALVVLETELWPATLAACAGRSIPYAVANARLTARSFPRYRAIRGLLAPYLAQAAAVAAQTSQDAGRFAALGVPESRIRVTGNMKYDATPPDPASIEEARALLRSLGWKSGSEPVLCAGSTRPGEEERAVLDAFQQLKTRYPSLRLIVAPRHIERADEAAAELKKRGIAFARVSSPANGPDCLLVDALGRLRALYAASDIAFVGGTLVPVGGHNLLEPAAAGVPVLFGPHTASIQAPAEALERAGGVRVADAEALLDRLGALLGDPTGRADLGRRARETAATFAGAADRTAQFLIERLNL